MWLLYPGLGIAVFLVIAAILLVKLHFLLKSRGYNVLFRSQNSPPFTMLKKDLDDIKESDTSQQNIESGLAGKSEKELEKSGHAGEAAVTLL